MNTKIPSIIEVDGNGIHDCVTPDSVQSIGEMEFSFRTNKCLTREGIRNLSELKKWSASRLLRIRNFGNTCLEEVEAKLRSLNESLSPD